MVDELVRQRIIPEAHVYFGSLPRWNVAKLLEESAKLMGVEDQQEEWRPEL
jgi:hypothetical protein